MTAKLPPHLSREWATWSEWCAEAGEDPLTPTRRSVAAFCLARLVGTTLAQRHAQLRAIRQVAGCPEAFDYPYPLITRWLAPSEAYPAVLARLRAGDDPSGAVAAVLFLRARVGDVVQVEGRIAKVADRVVPITDEVAAWLPRGPVPPVPGWTSVPDLHGALAAELAERGIPEKKSMALYGRQSAMVYRVAWKPVGLFRTALD